MPPLMVGCSYFRTERMRPEGGWLRYSQAAQKLPLFWVTRTALLRPTRRKGEYHA